LGGALAALFVGTLGGTPARADAPVEVVATFSVIGDMIAEIGGSRIDLHVLVERGGDTHVYRARPSDAKAIRDADIIFMNGLGFEGWLARLVEAAAYAGPIVEVADGIAVIPARGGATGHAHEGGSVDPHAWQSLVQALVYVENIRAGLSRIDAEGRAEYEANARRYAGRLRELDRWARSVLARIPPERRRFVTSHDAFRYLARDYEIQVLAVLGTSTESEISAADMAGVVHELASWKTGTVLIERFADPRLAQQIAREAGVPLGGTLYADTLSGPDGPASTYVEMFRHNVCTIYRALMGAAEPSCGGGG
jgi:zinc/manganese transport system substrate-binding protein